jgi:hypothetical protein
MVADDFVDRLADRAEIKNVLHCGRHGTFPEALLRSQILGDVSYDILDRSELIAFVVARWIAALVDDGAQLLRPASGCFV